MRVVSCHRIATPSGYSSILAILQFDDDGAMRGVVNNIRLRFRFLREPMISRNSRYGNPNSRGGGVGSAYYDGAGSAAARGDDDDGDDGDGDEYDDDGEVVDDVAADDGDDDEGDGGRAPDGERRRGRAIRIRCPNNGRKRKRTAAADDDDDGIVVVVAKKSEEGSGGPDIDGDDDGDRGKGRKGGDHNPPATTRRNDGGDGDPRRAALPPPPPPPPPHETMITYRIDYSIDYGEMKPLLGVDVYALGDHPSIAPPVPIIDDDDDDDDANEVIAMEDDVEEKDAENDEDDDAIDGGRRGSDDGTNGGVIPNTDGKGRDDDEKLRSRSNDPEDEFDDIVMSDDGSDSGDGNPADDESYDADGGGNAETTDVVAAGDRFGVFINPENVVAFLDRANFNLDEKSVFYFLMSFPFYEHEWDIAGFIFDALFDDDDEDGDVEDDDEVEGEEEEIDGEEDDGGNALDRFKKFLIGGNGSKNFCLPCN